MKSGGGLGPAAPLCHGRCETDGVGGADGEDGEDSSELRQGQQSKPHSPCRAGPFPSTTHDQGSFGILAECGPDDYLEQMKEGKKTVIC